MADILRDEKGRVLPGQKLALGNRGGGSAGRVKLPPELYERGLKALEFLCDVSEGVIAVDKMSERIDASKTVVKRVFGDRSLADDDVEMDARQVDRLKALLSGDSDEVDTP